VELSSGYCSLLGRKCPLWKVRLLKILSELNISYLKIAGISSQPPCLVSERALDDEQWNLK